MRTAGLPQTSLIATSSRGVDDCLHSFPQLDRNQSLVPSLDQLSVPFEPAGAGSGDRQGSLRVVRDTPKPLRRMVLSRASQSKAMRLGRQAGPEWPGQPARAPARLPLGVSQRLAGMQVRHAERRGLIAEGSLTLGASNEELDDGARLHCIAAQARRCTPASGWIDA